MSESSTTPALRWAVGGGLFFNTLALSILLVCATALAVGVAISHEAGYQIEQGVDRQLGGGAAFFRATLDERRQRLVAVGDWLSRDQDSRMAIQNNHFDDAQEELAAALQLQEFDELLVADPSGTIVVDLRVERPTERTEDLPQQNGFNQALAGRAVQELDWENAELLRQQVYLPIRPLDGQQPIAVLRLVSFTDQRFLNEFRRRTGLEVSLYRGEARISTTIQRLDGTPLNSAGADPAIVQDVVGGGQERSLWRELTIGRVRSFYAPLEIPDDDRLGMFSISLRADTLADQLRTGLISALLATLFILCAGTALAYGLASRVRQPLSRLAGAAARLREGDLTTPVPVVQERDLRPLAEQLERARLNMRAHLQAAEEEQARQRALIATLHVPILLASPEGWITDCNATATTWFGERDRLVGRHVREVLPFVSLASHGDLQPTRWQGSATDPTGRKLDVEVSMVTLMEGGLPLATVYAVHDISHHAELRYLQEQLLYAVSHELRGPISILENGLELLTSEYSQLSAKEFDDLLGSARRATQRLRTLTDHLLSAGSIQSGRFAVSPREMDLAPVVDGALEMVTYQLESRGQRVVCDLPAMGLRVLADPRYISQVLSNLLSNASKYSPDHATIYLRGERLEKDARISVEDRGPGIPVEHQAEIFERFYRVNPGYQQQPGIGLGLAIVQGIVEAHGGAIGLESEVGVGTSIWFTLPLVREAE